MILSLCWKDKAELDKRKKFRDDLDINLSSKQKESVYNPDTHSINLNRHNWITTVSSSIAQMLVLINWWWVMAKWLKWIWVAEGIASKAWLFWMSFITQVWQSYQEASNQGLNWWKAFSYSMLSATVQSALELVSPNEILLWKWSGITKELIRNLVKDWSKNSFMMLWKAFLKNLTNDTTSLKKAGFNDKDILLLLTHFYLFNIIFVFNLIRIITQYMIIINFLN